MAHAGHEPGMGRILVEGQEADDLARQAALAPGEILWPAGAPAEEVAVVVSGVVEVQPAGDLSPYEAGVGDLLGLPPVLVPGASRGTTVSARTAAVLRLYPASWLQALRETDPPRYARLLAAALNEQRGRFMEVGLRVARLAACHLQPVRDVGAEDAGLPPSAAHPPSAPTPVEPVLSTFPFLDQASPEALAELIAALRPSVLEAGQRLGGGSEEADLIVVVSGGLHLLWAEPSGPLLKLATMEPGSMGGIVPFLSEGEAGTTLIASEDATCVYTLSPAALKGLSDGARLVLYQSLLATMLAQQAAAVTRLSQLKAQEGREDLASLLAVMAGVKGWRAGAPAVEIAFDRLTVKAPEPVAGPEKQALFNLVRTSIIGGDEAVHTPFGLRRIVYADYTASGRNLSFIEDFIRQEVMPLYANTHTEASDSGRQTTAFREEARQKVAASVGAGEECEVIFVGSGATGAINKLIDILNLRLPADLAARYHLEDAIPKEERPVIFHGPYEHHSNILPWRHSIADVVVIPLAADGTLDLGRLEDELKAHQDRPLIIGSFSAASNVTGVATPVDEVASLLHRYGALSFWDYAAAGPYVPIEMSPPGWQTTGSHKDAVFISPHKFVGGPGTPGLLVVRKEIVKNTVPTQPGGGTVNFVTGGETLYSDSITHREEAGTPAIQESIRCGLVFHLKDQVGAETIHAQERAYVRQAIDSWRQNPRIRILGPLDSDRLSIVSFMVRHGARLLHHNFIIALLNDLFGIQARGGCSCAGPYGIALLGLDAAAGGAFMHLARCGYNSVKPGWARVNFNYFIGDEEFEYIVTAVHLVATWGYALLPHYRFDSEDGLWAHRERVPRDVHRLSDLTLTGGVARWESHHHTLPPSALKAQLAEGRAILEAAASTLPPETPATQLPEVYEPMRWFQLPHEVAGFLRHKNGPCRRPGGRGE